MENNENRKGYEFAGWYADPEFTKRLNPGGILPHELTFYDKWVPIEYEITYILNGGQNSEENPKTVNIESGVIQLHPAFREDRIFVGWSLNGKPTTSIPAGIDKNITLIANYKTFSKVRFDSRGGAIIQNKVVKHSKKLKSFRPPMRIGYEFDGWYWDVKYTMPFDFDQTIEHSCVLYAKWKVKEYTITYNTDGGITSRSNPKSFTYFDDVIPLKPAYKKGYEFIGWFDKHGNKQESVHRNSMGDKQFKAHYRKG